MRGVGSYCLVTTKSAREHILTFNNVVSIFQTNVQPTRHRNKIVTRNLQPVQVDDDHSRNRRRTTSRHLSGQNCCPKWFFCVFYGVGKVGLEAVDHSADRPFLAMNVRAASGHWGTRRAAIWLSRQNSNARNHAIRHKPPALPPPPPPSLEKCRSAR